jgi:hypothetical protein
MSHLACNEPGLTKRGLSKQKKTRTVVGPQPHNAPRTTQALTVKLAEGEDVQCVRTHWPHGTSSVTRYMSVKDED